MPNITDDPPQDVKGDLESLKDAIKRTVPSKKKGENLLIATWNIRSFGSLTTKWVSEKKDSPKRDLRALRAIAEIISSFDVIAIQEVVGNLRSLRHLMKFLGNKWSFLMTDITLGSAGNNERMAYIFDTERVQVSGLACEIVVPPEWVKEISPDALQKQFARTPYAVSFRAGKTTFILVTLHVDYGDAAAERVPELKALARWMADWAKRSTKWHHNLLTLGDFNIDREHDDLWKAFTSTGLTVPEDMRHIPRTIFADADSPTTDKYYDQIAWFTSGKRKTLDMDYIRGGYIDFLPHVYRGAGLTKSSISYRLSDHYPLWAEFAL